jgi:hypothetical protein
LLCGALGSPKTFGSRIAIRGWRVNVTEVLRQPPELRDAPAFLGLYAPRKFPEWAAGLAELASD